RENGAAMGLAEHQSRLVHLPACKKVMLGRLNVTRVGTAFVWRATAACLRLAHEKSPAITAGLSR
ncbi:hypothetical protein, partial [Klebsiella aerogenes]|uniref:hypothetical protein n=1 Tax=Klebsiella aerogenes TaxID=548 RepID=UPI001952FB87